MSNTKEYLLSVERQKVDNLNKDLFWEHEQHTHVISACSTCMSKETNSCKRCGRIIPKGNGYCSENCRIQEEGDWAYDNSINN